MTLTNYNATPSTAVLPGAMEDVFNGGSTSSINLPQYGVAVPKAR